jgi:hypothetical protein
MAPSAPELCSAAADAMARVENLSDCTLVAADGSTYEVSKAIIGVHSAVLGCVSPACCNVITAHVGAV